MLPPPFRLRAFRLFLTALVTVALIPFWLAGNLFTETASAQAFPPNTFRNFESPQVHPLAITPDGHDARLRPRRSVHETQRLVVPVEDVEALSGFVEREPSRAVADRDARRDVAQRVEHADLGRTRRRHVQRAVRCARDV